MLSILWIVFLGDQHMTMQEAGWSIKLEQQYTRPAGRRDANNACAVKIEMFCPSVVAWIKETHHCVADGIKACAVRSLVTVACQTSESKIIRLGGASVFESDDMVNLMTVYGDVLVY
jgi:hypothetical protein